MPVGIPKAGFRRSKKYWEKVVTERSVQDIENDLRSKAPRLLEELEKLTKPLECPNCGHSIPQMDKDVAFYLIDHAIGKAKMRQEIDVTSHVELNADQIDGLLQSRFGISIDDVRVYLEDRKLIANGS